jgi:HSP20 family molecular chaperone IbpA
MSNISIYRSRQPGLLGRTVFDDVFENLFNHVDLPSLQKRSTSGYPVADIFKDGEGNTIMEFALAGFSRSELNVDVQPERRSITVSATSSDIDEAIDNRRIARRNFQKTYVNYDDNLDLSRAEARFENGLLSIMVPGRPEVQPLSIEIM